MMHFFSKRIHPQFVLGALLGLSVTIILRTQRNIRALYHHGSQAATNQEAVKEELMKQLDPANVPGTYQRFEDAILHNDNDTLAEALYKEVRVLCWIPTSPKTMRKHAIHVKNTWARRCNVVLFMSSEEDEYFPAIGLNVTEDEGQATAKRMKALSYIYDHHLEDAEWFLKAEEHTYFVMENLRYMLSNEDFDDPVYFGHRFKYNTDQGYAYTGAGYVMSKAALKLFGKEGRHKPTLCPMGEGREDVNMGICMYNLGVLLKPSVDNRGRSRFHCFHPELFVNRNLPEWYKGHDMDEVTGGISNMSDYAISFNSIRAERMRAMEFFIYHLQPYGVLKLPQDVNVKE